MGSDGRCHGVNGDLEANAKNTPDRILQRLFYRQKIHTFATYYHFAAHLWLIGWPSSAALYAAVISWVMLPFTGAKVWQAHEMLTLARDAEDLQRRNDDLLR
jgi:hypothetical protein